MPTHFETIKNILLDASKKNIEKIVALNNEANQLLKKKIISLDDQLNQDNFVNFLLNESSTTRVCLMAQLIKIKEDCGFAKPPVVVIHQIQQLCVDDPLSSNTLL